MAMSASQCRSSGVTIICQWSQTAIPRHSNYLSPLLLQSQAQYLRIAPSTTRTYASKSRNNPPPSKRQTSPPKIQSATQPKRNPLPRPSEPTTTTIPISSQPPNSNTDFPIPHNNTYAHLLAQKQTPTILFTSQKSDIGDFATAAFAGTLGGLAITHTLLDFSTPGLWWATPYLSAGTNGVILALSATLLYRTLRPVSSITAIPIHNGNTNGLKLVIEGRQGPRIPFTSLRLWNSVTEECAVGKLQLSNSMLQNHLPTSPSERKMLYQRQDREREVMREKSLFWGTYFLKSIPLWFRDVVENRILEKRSVTMQVSKGGQRGGKWRLDVRNSWMLDQGLALNRLCDERLGAADRGMEGLRAAYPRRRVGVSAA